MDPLVDIVIEDPRWEAFGLAGVATRACDAALKALGLPVQGFTLCLMGCDDAHIATLNADFRGKPTPTNVLSWPSEERAAEYAGEVPDLPEAGPADDPEHLGDIAISWDTCLAEADAAAKPMADHVTHLVVHGLLHLLGYDHIDDTDAILMETTEARILEKLGLSDPYVI
ncbi:rRNA maturation RNase YbeY [Pseudorhodobacter aquimaris]|uniref:rRNA maturation RNase YbeY n=1 Tax=Pseudorhodobacter aquimaris TaxID=687412 RepID=UPI00067B9A8C|nr:rRNA maturation RNase YbeY [Pseudorhodobacter aquimaris]